jgi:soluble lytic murein transglycosylase-like protein
MVTRKYSTTYTANPIIPKQGLPRYFWIVVVLSLLHLTFYSWALVVEKTALKPSDFPDKSHEVVEVVEVEEVKSSKINYPPLISEVKSEITKQAQLYRVDVGRALAIAKAESSFRAGAVNKNKNGSTDKGVYQINSIHKVSDICRLDYKCNIEWAIRKMAREGFGAWNASKHKWISKK